MRVLRYENESGESDQRHTSEAMIRGMPSVAKIDSDKFDPRVIERAAQLVESLGRLRSPRAQSTDTATKAP